MIKPRLVSLRKIIVPCLVFLLFVLSLDGGIITYQIKVVKKPKTPEEKVLSEKATKDYDTVATVAPQPKIVSDVSQANQKVAASSPGNLGSGKVYLGFAFESRSSGRVYEVENQIGRAYPLYMTYVQWGNPPNSKIDSSFFSVFNATGRIPIISWEPWNPAQGVDQPTYKLTNISAGNFDPYIRSSAQAIKAYGRPVFMRWAHEMNGNWYPWNGTVNGNSAADYINAYRHVHDVFSSEGVGNVTWIWCPDTWSFPQFNGNNISDYYPGGNYVDWVGLDGYNFGNSKSGQHWKSFTELFSPGYKQVLGYGKPIMIAETASSESGGNKGDWISSTFTKEIPQSFPRIKAVIWFDINKETSWDINSSLNSISHFKTAVSSDIYRPEIRISNLKILAP